MLKILCDNLVLCVGVWCILSIFGPFHKKNEENVKNCKKIEKKWKKLKKSEKKWKKWFF